MGTTVEEKMQLNIDKSSWKLVKFGDVVFEPKAVVKNLQDEGVQHVVGLEHIDTEDIHLKRFASIEESTTFTKKFAKDDVLFGRRRAYLKKAAQAPFGGICSGDITVFRAKNDLLPALLPFVVNNAKFFDYAIKHSAGGLSPRVKFKDLANYSFLLPPKDQQAQLAELLWAMDEVIEREREVLDRFKEIKNITSNKLLSEGLGHGDFIMSSIGRIPKNWKVTKFQSIIHIMKSGLSRRIVSEDIGIPVIISGNIQEGRLDSKDLKYWYRNDPQGANTDNYILDEGDILLCFINSLSQIGKVCIFKNLEREAIYTTNLFRIVPNKEVDNRYLYYVLSSNKIQQKILQITKPAVNQASFTKEDFLRIKIAIPPSDEQQDIVKIFEQIEYNIDSVQDKITASKALQKSLINQIF